jgi:hypothetical protein
LENISLVGAVLQVQVAIEPARVNELVAYEERRACRCRALEAHLNLELEGAQKMEANRPPS